MKRAFLVLEPAGLKQTSHVRFLSPPGKGTSTEFGRSRERLSELLEAQSAAA